MGCMQSMSVKNNSPVISSMNPANESPKQLIPARTFPDSLFFSVTRSTPKLPTLILIHRGAPPGRVIFATGIHVCHADPVSYPRIAVDPCIRLIALYGHTEEAQLMLNRLTHDHGQFEHNLL